MRKIRFFHFCVTLTAIHSAQALILEGHSAQVFEHVPAAFGFGRDPRAPTTLQSQPLLSVSPHNGCAHEGEPSQPYPGSVLLLQRGGCNFTEKIAWAQQSNASGVIVYDDRPRGGQRWGVIMTADDNLAVQHIHIPSIFIAYETGLHLLKALGGADTESQLHRANNNNPHPNDSGSQNSSSSNHSSNQQAWLPLDELWERALGCGNDGGSSSASSSTCSSKEAALGAGVYVTVNATGNVLLRPLPVGPAETLAVYVAASLFLLMASIALWVGVALSLRVLRARQRERAIDLLETRTFQFGLPSDTKNKSTNNSKEEEHGGKKCEWRDNSTGCSICLEDYVAGDCQRILPCFHCFHDACIVPWLKERSVECPLCKQPVAGLAEAAAASSFSSGDEDDAWDYSFSTSSDPNVVASSHSSTNGRLHAFTTTTTSEGAVVRDGAEGSGATPRRDAASRGQTERRGVDTVQSQEAEEAVEGAAANGDRTSHDATPLTLHGVYGEPITLAATASGQASSRPRLVSSESSTIIGDNAEVTPTPSTSRSSSQVRPQASEERNAHGNSSEQQQRSRRLRRRPNYHDDGTRGFWRWVWSLESNYDSNGTDSSSSEWGEQMSSNFGALADLCVEDHFKICAFGALVALACLAFLAFTAFSYLGGGNSSFVDGL